MNFRQILPSLFLAVMLASAPLMADGARPDLPTLVLAVPQSGPLAPFGQSALRGAELALKTLGGGFNMELVDEMAPWPEDLSLAGVPVISGYFTESGLSAHAPRFIFLKKTVLLPFLGARGGAALDRGNFFRLMPSPGEEGEYLAMRALALSRRPRRVLIIKGEGENNAAITGSFTRTLAEPLQPPAPPAPKPGQRKPKAPAPVKPLDKNAALVTISPKDDLGAIKEFGKNAPDLLILAVDLPEALDLAPRLAASKFLKAPMWSGSQLGFREAGAAFISLNLKLSLALPVDLADNSREAVRDFNRAYIKEYKIQPTWLSALAYDSLNLAIKAVSATVLTGQISTFLNGHSHHSLGAYELAPGGAGRPPLTLMAVLETSLAHLP